MKNMRVIGTQKEKQRTVLREKKKWRGSPQKKFCTFVHMRFDQDALQSRLSIHSKVRWIIHLHADFYAACVREKSSKHCR